MKKYLDQLPKEIQDLLHLISKIARELKMPAYLVGGFVRDLFLGVSNFDLDIAIEGEGIVFAENLSKKLGGKLTPHRRFKTATLVVSHKLKIDIATARREIYPQAASLPEVTPGCLKDDLFRRDFTINAMAISISGEDYGRLIDLFGGRNDLRQKKIRILHDLSFIDDPTRILRAIRFQERFAFKMEPQTLKFLKAACRNKMLESVEPQRLRDELVLVLKENDPLRQIARIRGLAGFSFIHPCLFVTTKQLRLIKEIRQQVKWYNQKYYHRRQLDSWIVYLTGLIDSLKIAQVKLFCKKFAFHSGVEKRILTSKKINSGIIKKLSNNGIKPSEAFRILEPLSYETLIMLKAKYRDPIVQKNLKDFFNIYNGMCPHIRGDDLRKLGFVPGPHYKKIFTRVLNARLNGKIKTKEEEITFIVKLTKKGSSI